MNSDANPAESSPAAEVDLLGPMPDLDAMSAPDRDAWRLTGKVPSRDTASPDPSSPAESTPAEPAAQAASTDAKDPPASEPGKPAKRNAETRKAELQAEIEGLLRQRAELRASVAPPAQTRPQDAPAASSTASETDADEFPDFDAWLQAHEGKSYEAYTRDLARHVFAQERAQQEREREIVTRVSTFKDQTEAAVKEDPQFWQSLDPEIVNLRPVDALGPGEPVTPRNVLAQAILDSEMAPKLLRHLSDHPDELALVDRMTPAAVVRYVGRIEGASSVVTPPVSPKPIVTSAPKPPTTLGTKPAAPSNDLDDAVARGDFASYREKANRRDMGPA
jgi:hypothetical protein